MEKKVCITISDDEPDEEHGKMGDDWSMDLWDELVKNKPEQWDIRDALKHGKTTAEVTRAVKRHSINGRDTQ